MSNRDKCKKAIHEYIDSLDNHGIYEFMSDQCLKGTDIFDCESCESEQGNDKCGDAGECERRFLAWIVKQ